MRVYGISSMLTVVQVTLSTCLPTHLRAGCVCLCCLFCYVASPMGNDPATAEFEVAAGLGETLASGKRGSAWRLAVNKSTGGCIALYWLHVA